MVRPQHNKQKKQTKVKNKSNQKYLHFINFKILSFDDNDEFMFSRLHPLRCSRDAAHYCRRFLKFSNDFLW